MTPFCTSASEYSNSAATLFASSNSDILCGLETGDSVGNGGGLSQIGSEPRVADGDEVVGKSLAGRLAENTERSLNTSCMTWGEG
jgi:hypothetical protein